MVRRFTHACEGQSNCEDAQSKGEGLVAGDRAFALGAWLGS